MQTILAPKTYVDAMSPNKFSVYGYSDDNTTAPVQTSNSDGIPAAAFAHGSEHTLLLETDWAKRADIPVSVEYFMSTEEAGKGMRLQLGYSFDGTAFSWLNTETIAAASDKQIHQVAFTNPIPSTAIPSGDGHTLRVKVRRLGSDSADTHLGNFCLTAVKYYRIGG